MIYKGNSSVPFITADFSSETVEARKQVDDSLKCRKKKIVN